MPATDSQVHIGLRLNRIQAPVFNLGPGRRVGLWVQGCSLGCPGCVSPSTWAPEEGSEVDVRSLARALAEESEGFDGLTITGGEPFDQYQAIVILCTYLKALCRIHIHVFTGYTLEELIERHPDRAFLACIDALVDGRFRSEELDDSGWRGSRNQRLFHIQEGKPIEEEGAAGGAWSLSVSDGGQVFLSGIPRSADLSRLRERLGAAGIDLRFT